MLLLLQDRSTIIQQVLLLLQSLLVLLLLYKIVIIMLLFSSCWWWHACFSYFYLLFFSLLSLLLFSSSVACYAFRSCYYGWLTEHVIMLYQIISVVRRVDANVWSMIPTWYSMCVAVVCICKLIFTPFSLLLLLLHTTQKDSKREMIVAE